MPRADFLHFLHFYACHLYLFIYNQCRLSNQLSTLRQQLWRAYAALAHTLRRLQRSDPMVQGSFCLLRRKCGKPNCRCAAGQLHATYVLTRSEQGQDRLYTVPKDQRARVRQWAAEYRRYHRARALLAKRHLQLLALVDQMAEQRLLVWPENRPGPDA
jgi:hypothetical protein